SLNTLLFVLGSLWREPRPLERLQATLFVDVFRTPADAAAAQIRRSATTYDLNLLAQRIIGADEAGRLFQTIGAPGPAPAGTAKADDAFISQLERKLVGSVGAASALAMISQVVTGETISLDDLMQIAHETQRIREYSERLERKSRELEIAASQ